MSTWSETSSFIIFKTCSYFVTIGVNLIGEKSTHSISSSVMDIFGLDWLVFFFSFFLFFFFDR